MNEEIKKDYYYPKRKAVYSLQFGIDKEGTPEVTETANRGSINFIEMRMFGGNIANSELLDLNDKHGLAAFCKGYLKEFRKKVGEDGFDRDWYILDHKLFLKKSNRVVYCFPMPDRPNE